jgi:flavin-binding protein dodecin
VRIIELVGVSEESWTGAARQAVTRAAQTIRHVTGVDVQHQTAVVRDSKIVEYHVNLKVSLIVEPTLDLAADMDKIVQMSSV